MIQYEIAKTHKTITQKGNVSLAIVILSDTGLRETLRQLDFYQKKPLFVKKYLHVPPKKYYLCHVFNSRNLPWISLLQTKNSKRLSMMIE